MKTIGFVYYNSKGILPSILKWWTEHRFNHVAIHLVDSSIYYEANGHNPLDNGVMTAHDPYENHGGYKAMNSITLESRFIMVDDEKYKQISLWLSSQKGKKYDYPGGANFFNRKIAQDPQKWYCSELAAAVWYMCIGKDYLDCNGNPYLPLISPGKLYDNQQFYYEGYYAGTMSR